MPQTSPFIAERHGLRFAYEPSSIFNADAQWTHGREPVLRPMPDGSLVCWIYGGGDREPDNANVILSARSLDRGETWSTPELLFEHSCRGVWGTEIFTGGDLPMGAVHTLNAACHYLELRAAFSVTHDSGRTWTEPVAPRGVPANLSIRQGLVLDDGAWLFPVYWMEAAGTWNWVTPEVGSTAHFGIRDWTMRCGVIRSENRGQSWSLHGYLTADTRLWEPSVVQLTNGDLLMLIRAEATGLLYQSRSADGGRSWTPAEPTDIPSPSTKTCLLRHGDRILLLHNPTPNKVGRKRVELWVSDDDCRTWPLRLPLVETMGDTTCKYGGGRMICYPHAFLSDAEQLLYVAVDSKAHFHLLKVPYGDFA